MITAWNRLLSVGFVVSFSIGCDQTTKRIAEQTLSESPMHSLFFDTLRLQFVHNHGVLMGLGSNLSLNAKYWLFFIVPMLLLGAAIIFVLCSKKLKYAQTLWLSLIIGGGAGNLIDRIMQGSVTDFINVGIGPVRTGIFNIADVAILAGALGLIAVEYWPGSKNNAAAALAAVSKNPD